MESWHVLYTKPHSEFRVKTALQVRGIEPYLPVLPVARPRTGRAPLGAFFPCYVFARYDLLVVGESNIAYLPGLRYVLMTGGKPAVVASELIEHISRRLAESKALVTRGEIISPGDAVEVLRPGFEEFDVVFDTRLSPAGRVQILVRHLERQYPLYRSIEHVKAVEIDVDEIRKKPPRVNQ